MWVHASKASGVTRSPALGSNFLDLLFRAIGKVAWIGVVCHDGWDENVKPIEQVIIEWRDADCNRVVLRVLSDCGELR